MTRPVCPITCVGAGTGAALARRVSTGGCRVAMVARGADRLAALEPESPRAGRILIVRPFGEVS